MKNLYNKQKSENNKKGTEPIIDKISKNNEIKGMAALTGGVVIAAFAIGGIVIVKGALITLGSGYLITKGILSLVKYGKKYYE